LAILIVSIAIGASLALLIQNVRLGQTMDRVFIAGNLAKNRLERLKTMNFDELVYAQENETMVDRDGNPDNSGDFKRTSVVTTDYGGERRLTRVDVEVYYKRSTEAVSNEFVETPVTLSTIFTNVVQQ
jgi:hypothetical protein